jgi:signal transduction protein with GAF and PtsI domain
MDELLPILDEAIAAVGADGGTVHMLGSDGMLHLRAARNVPEPVQDIVRMLPVGKGMAGLTVERNAPVNACNLQTDTSGDVRPGAKATGMEGAIVVPIRRSGSPVGALGVANHSERTFSEEEQQTLSRFAGRIASVAAAAEETAAAETAQRKA